MNWKIALGGIGVLTTIFVGLFIKNKHAEKSYQELSKEKLIIISRKIRKQRYIVYKQIALFAANIMQQMRNNINTNLIQQYINGPQSPLKVKKLFEQINQKVCQQYDISSEQYASSLDKFKSDIDIQQITKLHQNDYTNSLRGKLPNYNVVVPAQLTKQKFIEIQNRITKLVYCQQVKVFRKLKQYTQMQLQQNPALLTDLGNPEEETQTILKQQGLQTQFQPASAVFKQAQLKLSSDAQFKAKIDEIQRTYQAILRKYAYKLQNKSITDNQLNILEEQILRIDIRL